MAHLTFLYQKTFVPTHSHPMLEKIMAVSSLNHIVPIVLPTYLPYSIILVPQESEQSAL